MPLALLWFGQTEGAMLFVVVMGTRLVGHHRDGQRRAQRAADLRPRRADDGLAAACTRWTRVMLPASLPFIVSGMKQGWAFAWRSLMAAEIYVTILTGFGLGHLLHYGRELHAMDQVIGVMLVIVADRPARGPDAVPPWERFLHRRWGTGQA